ncbi:MAG: 2-C-methyl-D-erythritol 2,4-cyclodiphosphate synthase [Gammaproteobacteria bacterium]|nr:2-C-methyl-D-erythritol 2,4-cyclodiphosphate synthase [Gammaproteobacteria bacterium]
MRTGNGVDIHRFSETSVEGQVIILGGVEIPHRYELQAHSDGDVLTHALMDAILGALALGDIGKHFPDTDNLYENASSLALLESVMKMIKTKGWELGNADITVVAQAPKLSPFTQQIRESLSHVLEVGIDQISIKATTSEGLGFTGRQEGIAVFSTVLLTKA